MIPRTPLSTLVVLLTLAACGGGDRNTRLHAAIEDLCALEVRCASSGQPRDENCVEERNVVLAAVHHVYGEGCIDAALDQMECRLGYDCYLPSDLWCPDGGAECELVYPCDELVPAAERACGGFASGPSLGIGSVTP